MKDAAVTALTVDNVPLIQTARLEDYSPEYWALSASKGAVVIQMLRSTMGREPTSGIDEPQPQGSR